MLKRRSLVLCLVCALLFSITACTGGRETPQTTPTTTGGDTTTTTTAPPTGGTTVFPETVDVELRENGFALGDAVFTIGGDPSSLIAFLEEEEKEPRMWYETVRSEAYAGHRVAACDYYTKGTDEPFDEHHSDRVCTVTAAGETEERLTAWYTVDKRYRFNGVAVGASVSKLLQQWGDESEQRDWEEEDTDWRIGESNAVSVGWVYPYNEAYNVVFYFSGHNENMKVQEIGIEAAKTLVDTDGATVASPKALAVVLDDDTFTVNGVDVEKDGDAAPLLAMLGTPEIVDANGYTDADPNSWFTVYTYSDCEVETWTPRDGSEPERFCRLLLTGERHTVNGVSVGDKCQTAVAALTPHFASAAELGGNHQWRPPFDAYVEFRAATGVLLRCGLGKYILDDKQEPATEITAYNDRAIGMLAVG